MDGARSQQQGTLGQTLVTAAFERLDWGPVPVPGGHDKGTDLLCIVRDRRLVELGLVVGVQVKARRTPFHRRVTIDGRPGWWYTEGRRKHLEKWASSGVPHLLVLHNPDSEINFWVHVTRRALTRAGRGWKIFVPESQVLDEHCRNDLLEVAGSARPTLQLQGSTWQRRPDVLDSDMLRHALIVPRLIAPHPNAGVATAVTATQAVALIVRVRLHDLERFGQRHAAVPTPSEMATASDWTWRFAAALHERVTSGEGQSVIDRVDDAPDPARRAAAAAAAAALLIEQTRPDEALQLLDRVRGDPQLSPIDHAWMHLHRARACLEAGDVETVEPDLAEAIRISATHPNDVTATAIAGAAAQMLFTAAGAWDQESLAQAISAGDTAAAWWSSQIVSSGLAAANEREFASWTRHRAIIFSSGDHANDQLLSAGLIAGHVGDHGTWRRASAMLVRDAMIRLNRHADPEKASELLRELCAAGDSKSVERAAQRLVSDGPAAAPAQAAVSIGLDGWTRTTASARLKLIRAAGDVLPAEFADRATQWLSETIAGPEPFVDRVQPSFVVSLQLIDTLTALVAGTSEVVRAKTVEQVAGLAPERDQSVATSWARLVDRLDPRDWEAIDPVRLRHASDGHHDVLALRLLGVAARSDEVARVQLLDRARSGNLDAMALLGDIRGLPADVVTALVERCADRIHDCRATAAQGSSSWGGPDHAADLLRLNLCHPGQARWPPLLELIRDPIVATGHKEQSLRILADNSAAIPDEARPELLDAVRQITGPSPLDLQNTADPVGLATEVACALGPVDEHVVAQRLHALLTTNRAGAARLATRVGGDESVGLLVALATDEYAATRATAVAGLADLLVRGERSAVAETALLTAVDDPGTSVPIALAATLAGKSDLPHLLQDVITLLADHRSARARSFAASRG